MSLKSELISGAYSQLRISGLTVTPSPELIKTALRRLEAMMARFDKRGLCIGYNFEQNPDVNTESGVPIEHEEMVETNLAVHLVPDFNKTVPQILLGLASSSFSTSSGIVARENIKQVQPSARMPVGSGNRWNRHQRFNNAPVVIAPVCIDQKMTVGNVDDFSESFNAYLDGETIASFTIAAETGLTVNSSSNTDDVVSYRATATATGTPRVTIAVTTSAGRIETRLIQFEVV